MDYVYSFATSLVTMAVLDAAWLGFIAPSFYKKHLGFIMAEKPKWWAAVIFYFVFILGITVFIVYPGWRNAESLVRSGVLGALFGLVTYATYDLTNQATLKNWPPIVTIVDLVWGTVLTATVSVAAVSLLRMLAS